MLDITQVERMLKGFDDDRYNDDDDDDLDDDDLGDLESELDSIVNAGGSGVSKSAATTSSSNQESYFAQLSQPPPPAPSVFSSVPLKPQVFMPPAPSSRAPPPPVRIPEPDYNTAATPALPPRPEEPRAAPPNSNAQKIAQIKQLQIEYKRAALKAKTDQDKTAALAHFKVSKVCFAVIFGLPCITNTIFL